VININLCLGTFTFEADTSKCMSAAVCPKNCSSRGVCAASGLCECSKGFFGAACDVGRALGDYVLCDHVLCACAVTILAVHPW